MSVLNKMLQELDQRHATTVAGNSAVRPVRGSIGAARKGREAFWRLLALLMLACVGGVAFFVYQAQVQPVVTNLALKAAEDARMRPSAVAVTTTAPVVSAIAAPPASVAPAAPAQILKLASSIETQIPPASSRKPAVVEDSGIAPTTRLAPKAETRLARAREHPDTGAPPASIPSDSPRLEKRDRPRMPQEQAEADFRRAVALLNDGRNGDAQDALSAALTAYQGHEAARQALASLLLEQRKIEPARRVLQEGIAMNPANVVFAHSLARIMMESRDYDGAVAVLQGTGAAGTASIEIQSLVGAAQQRLSHHREAMQAYQAALRLSPASGSSWIGLGISLEALGHKPEAAEAFRRAIGTGSLNSDLRAIAETRLSQLQ